MDKIRFKQKIANFLKISGMSPTALSLKVGSEPGYIKDILMKDRESRDQKQKSVIKFMNNYLRKHKPLQPQ